MLYIICFFFGLGGNSGQQHIFCAVIGTFFEIIYGVVDFILYID